MNRQSAWVICGLCNGDQKVVNPSIDAGGLSREDFDDDPDFAEAYMSGAYDIQCPRCNGRGSIRESDQRRIIDREHAAADDRRLAAREDGDFEGYCTAGDARWGHGADDDDEEQYPSSCSSPTGHEFPRDIEERDRCLCIHCGADGDA